MGYVILMSMAELIFLKLSWIFKSLFDTIKDLKNVFIVQISIFSLLKTPVGESSILYNFWGVQHQQLSYMCYSI